MEGKAARTTALRDRAEVKMTDDRDSSVPPEPAGDPFWSTVMGAVTGAAGGVVFVYVTQRLDSRAGAIAALVGSLVGSLIGRLTRRLLRWVPRIFACSCLASALWLFAYAFVLARLAPWLVHTLPLGTSIVAAAVYGACVGAIPPLRVRREHGRDL
jgi:hypothetical protein